MSFAHALGGLMCGLGVANVYQECEQEWVKRVCGKTGIVTIALHTITGYGMHTLSIVPSTVITQLAQYIYRRFHSLFDVR
jgi:hypothetical protein